MTSKTCTGKRCVKLLTGGWNNGKLPGKPVWMVDGNCLCTICFEKWCENHFIDEHRVHRISDVESDFLITGEKRTSGRKIYQRRGTPCPIL